MMITPPPPPQGFPRDPQIKNQVKKQETLSVGEMQNQIKQLTAELEGLRGYVAALEQALTEKGVDLAEIREL